MTSSLQRTLSMGGTKRGDSSLFGNINGISMFNRSSKIQQQQALQHSVCVNIFCSEMVGRDTILVDFDKLGQNKRVLELEMEDLLTTEIHYHDLTPVVGKLLFANDRPWERIQFLDSFDISEFETWNQRRDTMMRDYERVWVHLPGTQAKDVLMFKAVVSIPEGTSVNDLLAVFQSLEANQDVATLSLFGLRGVPVKGFELESLFEETTLQEGLSMELECAWDKSASSAASARKLTQCCIDQLLQLQLKSEQSQAQAQAQQAQEPDFNSSLTGPLASLVASVSERSTPSNTPSGRGTGTAGKATSLQAMRRSIQDSKLGGITGPDNSRSSLMRRSRTTALSRTPPGPSIRRTLSDSGDIQSMRDAAATARRARQRPTTRANARATRGVQRSVSDSGDVLPTRSAAEAPRRPRRSRDASDSSSPSSATRTKTLSPMRRNKSVQGKLQRALSDSGDVLPKGKRRNKSDPSLQRLLQMSGASSTNTNSNSSRSVDNASTPKRNANFSRSAPKRNASFGGKAAKRSAMIDDDMFADESHSEYSVEMDDSCADLGITDDLELLQLKELQILGTNTTTDSMDIHDLLSMRKALDAAIASMKEMDTPETKAELAGNNKKTAPEEEGPDYNWKEGVYCRKQAPPRAA